MASPYILTSPQRQFPQQFLPQQQYQPRPQPQLPPQRVVPPSPYKPGPQAPPPQFQQPMYRQPQFPPYQPQGIIQQSPNRPPFPVQQRPPVYSSQSLPVGRQPVQGLPPQLQGKPQGVPGPQGIPQGFQGPQGLPQGLQGPPGPQGLQGPPPGHQIPPYGPQGYQQFKPPQGVQGVQPGLIRSQQQPPYPPQRQGPPQPVKPPQPQTQQKPQQQQQKYPNQLAPPPQYKQPQAQLVDNNQQYLNAKKQQDEDLEKKFQEAISRTHDLVNRFQQPQQEPPKQGPPQMMAQQDDPDLVDLALQYEDGYIYRGQGLEPATRQGFGILTDSAEQEVYSGWWHDNQYHGQGKLVNFQSEQIDGPFDYRDLSNIDNGWVGYEGEFFEGKMHGRGLLQLTNNEKFEGTFNDGMIDGQGVFTRIDGQEIRGIWKDGSLVQVQD